MSSVSELFLLKSNVLHNNLPLFSHIKRSLKMRPTKKYGSETKYHNKTFFSLSRLILFWQDMFNRPTLRTANEQLVDGR